MLQFKFKCCTPEEAPSEQQNSVVAAIIRGKSRISKVFVKSRF